MEEVVRVNSRRYSALGEVIDELARKRNVRGPHAIANHMKSRLGEAPTGAAVSKWMYGDSRPLSLAPCVFASRVTHGAGVFLPGRWL